MHGYQLFGQVNFSNHILIKLLLFSAAIKPKNNRLCPDGKTSPLVEGEDNIFPCIYDCPTGFTCEGQGNLGLLKICYIVLDSPDGGICCPDLEVLYELYADKSQKDAKMDQLDGQMDVQVEDAFDLPNVPNVPVVIVDQKEVRWF